ncbi:MAG: glycerophosphodiester phosphodiesterase family protein [Allosphingosinicella sp.]|uniref:glycerophosphodiester phosphodiesterase family protein n=1 Tax=Allosphingosinicella sp. TaxID=2823234 RepID=UPI00395D028C
MKKGKLLLLALAAVAVILSLMNASWIAPEPQGAMTRIANRGIAQPVRPGEGCDAARLGESDHPYIENALAGLRRAASLGARGVAVDVQPTADGRMVAFRDPTLDCRTNGTGPVAERTLAQLKALDAGWGYTPDGENFPLRGRGIGAIPTVEEVLQELGSSNIVFNFVRAEPGDADLLMAAFRNAGVEPDGRIGFVGDPAVVARMQTLAPEAWAFDRAASEACRDAYFATGWTGIVPDQCRGITVALDLEQRWRNWGWPNRYLKRMADAGTRVMLVQGFDANGSPVGLTDVAQLPLVPRQFNGMLWIEDMHDVGRAIR